MAVPKESPPTPVQPRHRGRWRMGMAALALGLALAGCASDSAIQGGDKSPEEERATFQMAKFKADAYLERGNFQMAVPSLLKMLEIRPDDVDTLLTLGGAYIHQGRYLQALESLERAHRLKPGRGEVNNYRGVALMNLERFEEAKGAFLLAGEDVNYQQREDAFYHLAVLASRQGLSEEMVAHLGQAIKLNPGMPLAHIMLSAHYASKHQPEREQEHLKAALAAQPDNLAVLELLAEFFQRQGRKPQAREMWSRIISIAPESEYAERAKLRLKGLEN